MRRSPSEDEAAAIAAAIARFQAETASAGSAPEATVSPWQHAALTEGVSARAAVLAHREGGVKWLS